MTKSEREVQSENLKNKTWTYIKYVLSAGIFMVTVVSLYTPVNRANETLSEIISRIGVGFLIGGASLSAGGFMGFLFGIPSLQQNLSQNTIKATTLKYNDNLVQISDWLTKIIVGVGLTQLYKIPHKVMALGEYLKPNFGDNSWGRNASLAIVFYFLLFGFLLLYFWTRTDFTMMMKDTDDDLQEELDVEKEKNDKLKTKLETVKEENKHTEEDIKAVLQTFSTTADEIKVKKVEAKSSINIPDDPQKGLWGGMKENNDRRIHATVRETGFNSDWFTINLEVISTNAAKPLSGKVKFHIHPSFPNSTEVVDVKNGAAELQLVSYGSFTVGAECDFNDADSSDTKLELDLAELAGVSQKFKDR